VPGNKVFPAGSLILPEARHLNVRRLIVSHRTRALFLFPIILSFLFINPFQSELSMLPFFGEGNSSMPPAAQPLPDISFSRPPAYVRTDPGFGGLAETEASSNVPVPDELLEAGTVHNSIPGGINSPAEAKLAPAPAPDPQVVAEQVKIFEELWGTVQEQYLYEDFNGLDWEEVHNEYTVRIQAGLEADEFYLAMDEMIIRLGDDHSKYLSPQQVAAEQAKYAGKQDYAGIGILLAPVKEHQQATVVLTFPGGPAEKAGIKPRDSIYAVDGKPILDSDGALKDLIRGPEGTRVKLTVGTPGEDPREVHLTRRRINGPLPVPYTVMNTKQGQRIGYVFLVTFADSTISGQIENAIEEMNREAPLDGLILDNRQNEGGASTVLTETLGFFTGGLLGHFISRQEETALEVDRRHIFNSQDLPLVVLVGQHTFSYGEIFAGILQDIGRAFLIGETTQGNVETLTGFNFADGSRAWIAYKSFRPLNQPQKDWEATGIVPDLNVQANWYDHSLEDDPVILSSLEYLDNQVEDTSE
jgi:carboxyl-terminal processing protease